MVCLTSQLVGLGLGDATGWSEAAARCFSGTNGAFGASRVAEWQKRDAPDGAGFAAGALSGLVAGALAALVFPARDGSAEAAAILAGRLPGPLVQDRSA